MLPLSQTRPDQSRREQAKKSESECCFTREAWSRRRDAPLAEVRPLKVTVFVKGLVLESQQRDIQARGRSVSVIGKACGCRSHSDSERDESWYIAVAVGAAMC